MELLLSLFQLFYPCCLLESHYDINFNRAHGCSQAVGLGLNASLSDDEYKAGMCAGRKDGYTVYLCTASRRQIRTQVKVKKNSVSVFDINLSLEQGGSFLTKVTEVATLTVSPRSTYLNYD